MISINKLLKIGLIAMSKSMQNGFWLHGHVGAEVLTNTFFMQEFELNKSTEKAVLGRIEWIIKTKKEYLSDTLLNLKGVNCDISEIEIKVEENINKLSTSGHGVIFGALIIKAIKQLNGWLPEQVKDGLIALLDNTQNDFKERYYNHYDYQNTHVDISDLPRFKTPDEIAKYTLTHQKYYESREIDGRFYHFHGKQIHDITHANALVILDEIGYPELAEKGLKELTKQIKLGTIPPPTGESYQTNTIFDPFDPSFWTRDVEDEHHFKLAYAVLYLLKKYPELDRKEILSKISGHWELMN